MAASWRRSGADGMPIMDEVPLIDDLAALGRVARRRRLPIVLLVSRSDCPYCTRLKDEVLNPMMKSREYDDQALLGELMLDSEEPLRGFQGGYVLRDDVASGFGTDLTPTLLFLAPDGSELAPRIVGINTLELFGFYVDRAIESARARLVTD